MTDAVRHLYVLQSKIFMNYQSLLIIIPMSLHYLTGYHLIGGAMLAVKNCEIIIITKTSIAFEMDIFT